MCERSAFFYGTLMAPQVLYRVLYGSTTPHASLPAAIKIQPAILPHYVRHRVAFCDYPAILASPDPSACVRGTYVEGLTAADQWRLDVFEGDQYERVKVKPRLLDAGEKQAEEVEADTYVWVAPREELEEGEWDFGEFRREKMSRWVRRSQEYEEVDEAVEKAKEGKDPTGGRFLNGEMTRKHGGEGEIQSKVIEGAV
ncbi:MAG: hypothetical protein Q9217_002658 [Psora testacea]